MKTASIITMHCPLNYGAVLQTYALQTFIENHQIKTTVIDYNPEYIVFDQSLMYVGDSRFKKNLIFRWLYRAAKYPAKSHRIKQFDYFKKNELHLTQRFNNYDEIKKAHLDADHFFCGSDQIWNTVSGSHKDPAYFLGFVDEKAKRHSYAASGNLPIDDDEVRLISLPLINDLSHVSMREDVTINAIQPFIEKPISHVCDPVFLLNAEDWRSVYNRGSRLMKNKRYVLIYPMGNGVDTVIQKGYELAEKTGLPLYCISASLRKDKRIDKVYDVNPYTFLALIDNADYIITNSFHGTSFSIIFKKAFWSCTAIGANQRISCILEKTGLEERAINIDSDIDVSQPIDYSKTDFLLNSFIAYSKSYIDNILKG